jgi:hypothetical protein
MATIKMTFSIPEELAQRFLRRVPSRQRSSYVTAALEKSLRRRDEELVRACRLANQDADLRAAEREMAALADPIEEPWDESPAR